MSKYASSKGKIYKHVHHYANLYRISLKINNEDIVKTVPDTFTKVQVRIAITDLMRKNGLNEAQIKKSMEGWGEENKVNTKHVKFPIKTNKTGYLGVGHKISLCSGQFACMYKRELHDTFTYPIRQFSEGIYWVKEKELLKAHEQACNASDMKRYGEILIGECPRPKNNLLSEMKDYCLKKNRSRKVDEIIITDSITSLIQTLNASSKNTERFSLVNVTGHKLVHPYISNSHIGYQITSTSNPKKNEIFSIRLNEANDNARTYDEKKLKDKYIEACIYADNKFDLPVKQNSEYAESFKVIDWEKRLSKALHENNKQSNTKPVTILPIKKASREEMLSKIPAIRPFITADKIGYTFSDENDLDYKNTRTIPIKKLKENLYWAHPTKALDLYVETYKLAAKSIGLKGVSKKALIAENSEQEWLEMINNHFNNQSNDNNQMEICFTKTIGDLRNNIIKEKREKRTKALVEEITNIKNTNNESGHPHVKAKIEGAYAIYFTRLGSAGTVQSKVRLNSIANSEYTIDRKKLIKAFVIICRKVDRHRKITSITDDTYSSLYRDINWLAAVHPKNKRFKAISITE